MNQVRHILIIISLIFLNSPLIGDSNKGGILFGWETSYVVQLRKFGDKDTQPQYKGDVESGKPNGLGIMIYPNGSKYIGEWKNGKMDGQGTFTFPSGNKYVEKYKDGKKWNVTKYDKKGNFVGDWKDREHLNGALYDKFGKFIGKYVNGELR